MIALGHGELEGGKGGLEVRRYRDLIYTDRVPDRLDWTRTLRLAKGRNELRIYLLGNLKLSPQLLRIPSAMKLKLFIYRFTSSKGKITKVLLSMDGHYL